MALGRHFSARGLRFRRDTLDYTQTKGKTLLVVACGPGRTDPNPFATVTNLLARTSGFDAGILSEKLQVAWQLDEALGVRLPHWT